MPASPKRTIATENARRSIATLTRQALKVIHQAVNDGDVATAKWVMEMHMGKPKQVQELAGAGGGPLTVNINERAKDGGEP